MGNRLGSFLRRIDLLYILVPQRTVVPLRIMPEHLGTRIHCQQQIDQLLYFQR